MRPAPLSRRAGKAAAPRKAATIACYSVVLLLAGWAGGATLYILFSDDALKILAERQVSLARAYEGQISALQTEIDRLRSLKLIDQERVDQALAELARRQNAIETRQAAIAALGGGKTTPSLPQPEITGTLSLPAGARPRPTPLSSTILIAPPTSNWARLESRPLPPLGDTFGARGADSATEVRVHNLSRAVAAIESGQRAALNELEAQVDGRAQRMRKVLAELGLERTGSGARLANAASGGPFLPWTRPPDDPFARQMHRIRAAKIAASALEEEIGKVPVRRPAGGQADVTSAFGMRLDPFLRQPAMHTGIDFRGDTGDEVRASAAGRVVQAERNGGYGLMVEIDHGNGIASRYAHLSALVVHEGQRVMPGDMLGRVGSTGRSTGPHLHFEVRIDGEATDPQRFLRAGLRLDAAR